MSKRGMVLIASAGVVAAEVALIRLGRTYGSTPEERCRLLPGDAVIREPQVQTDHAITIDAPPAAVWPWIVQMGWGRAGWYTARWVDLLLFPDNGPSAARVVPELQDIEVGTFIPDGPPHTECGFQVVSMETNRSLVLHSTSHLPRSWRDRATLDWTWAFVLTPQDGGRRCRYHLRSRWDTSPWWVSAAGLLGIVPADFLMSRDHLRGVKHRAERLLDEGGLNQPPPDVAAGSAPTQAPGSMVRRSAWPRSSSSEAPATQVGTSSARPPHGVIG